VIETTDPGGEGFFFLLMSGRVPLLPFTSVRFFLSCLARFFFGPPTCGCTSEREGCVFVSFCQRPYLTSLSVKGCSVRTRCIPPFPFFSRRWPESLVASAPPNVATPDRMSNVVYLLESLDTLGVFPQVGVHHNPANRSV